MQIRFIYHTTPFIIDIGEEPLENCIEYCKNTAIKHYDDVFKGLNVKGFDKNEIKYELWKS